MTAPPVQEITEVAPEVFGTLLAACSCQVLSHLLLPAPTSFVWLVAYHPHGVVEWVTLPLPLRLNATATPLTARLPRYDLQFSLSAFLSVLPQLHARAGMLALQMERPVPDTLTMEHLADNSRRRSILRENGLLLSFDLPHDGEYAWVETYDRAHLEGVLNSALFASRDLP